MGLFFFSFLFSLSLFYFSCLFYLRNGFVTTATTLLFFSSIVSFRVGVLFLFSISQARLRFFFYSFYVVFRHGHSMQSDISSSICSWSCSFALHREHLGRYCMNLIDRADVMFYGDRFHQRYPPLLLFSILKRLGWRYRCA